MLLATTTNDSAVARKKSWTAESDPNFGTIAARRGVNVAGGI